LRLGLRQLGPLGSVRRSNACPLGSIRRSNGWKWPDGAVAVKESGLSLTCGSEYCPRRMPFDGLVTTVEAQEQRVSLLLACKWRPFGFASKGVGVENLDSWC
jgi:hypothetical protein